MVTVSSPWCLACGCMFLFCLFLNWESAKLLLWALTLSFPLSHAVTCTSLHRSPLPLPPTPHPSSSCHLALGLAFFLVSCHSIWWVSSHWPDLITHWSHPWTNNWASWLQSSWPHPVTCREAHHNKFVTAAVVLWKCKSSSKGTLLKIR